MSDIYIGKSGKILKGDELGWMVKVVDDSDNTGGFLILTWDENDPDSGFDGWVEDYESLEQYFKDSNWVIEWLDDKDD